MEKEFKTIKELIDLLEKRNIVIDDESRANTILSYESYYSVINGYKDLFLATTQPDDYYRDGTKFDDIFALYCFDRKLREILLIELLRIEKAIRTEIVYVFSEHHGHDHNLYLNEESFNVTSEKNTARAKSVICTLEDLINDKKDKYNAIKHYIGKYGYVPLWVLANVMTFGVLTSFYGVMLYPEKLEISKHFRVNPKEMKSLIDFLARFRNKCAHGERIYCFSREQEKQFPIPILSEHKKLRIPHNEKGYKYGTSDVLALLIAMKYFMPRKRFNRMIDSIDRAISQKLGEVLSIEMMSEVCRIMGFVNDWKSLKS